MYQGCWSNFEGSVKMGQVICAEFCLCKRLFFDIVKNLKGNDTGKNYTKGKISCTI